ncbi:CG5050 [Drosophila busckii]|uniref:CG5050 n=1 Tax=Drosophila busckii TaxID=30019 RepID=A0A0M4EGY4_DROBS|nr:CG5050 [Drosophila busckii]
MELYLHTNKDLRCARRRTSGGSITSALCPANPTWSSDNDEVMLTAECLMQPQAGSVWSSNPETAASMKIFTSVMLHAWRQRRAEVRNLQSEVDNLQKRAMQRKNELHVCNTLMRVEKKRCQELQLQLNHSNLSINQVRSSCEKLSSSLVNLSADKEMLERELDQCKEEYEDLHLVFKKNKDELLNALLDQRNLQQHLCQEQRTILQLTMDKDHLMDELSKLRKSADDYERREHTYIIELSQKNEMFSNMRTTIEALETQISDLKRSSNTELAKLREMEKLKGLELVTLRQQLENPKSSNCQPNLLSKTALLTREYSLSQVWTRIYYYTTNAVFFLWLILLPSKSVRNGCMPPTHSIR